MPSGTQARVRVLLYPYQDAKQPVPCPAGVTIQLKKKGARLSSAINLITEAGGVTAPATLAVGTAYQVSITDPHFGLWGAAADLEVQDGPAPAAVEAVVVGSDETGVRVEAQAVEKAVAAAQDEAETRDIELVPQAGRRLVFIRLVTDGGQPVSTGTVSITAAGDFNEAFTPFPDGSIYAVAPMGSVMLRLAPANVQTHAGVQAQSYCPQTGMVPYTVPATAEVRPIEFIYWPAIQIVAKPTIVDSPGSVPETLYGTSVTVVYENDQDQVSRTKTLTKDTDDGSGEISFYYCFPGKYTITATPPGNYDGLPVKPLQPAAASLSGPTRYPVPADFEIVPTETVGITVTAPDEPVTGELEFEIYNGNTNVRVKVDTNTLKATAVVPTGIPLKIRLAMGSDPMIGPARLQMSSPDQAVASGTNTINLEYQHSLTIDAVDELGKPVPNAMIDVYYGTQATPITSVVVNDQGSVVLGLKNGGTYYLAQHSEGGEVAIRQPYEVHSNGRAVLQVQRGTRGAPGGGAGVTDLSAYPVLTEEVSTIGPPAPAVGAPSAGGSGAGYGQTVDQVMRDVLGWRPSGDVTGFQAALAGAFQLREVEGHTEWSWQQRGYAVQADMGALTGAQASIYARAKSALDQIQPLLTGITALNPLLYPPEDLESIRAIIGAELQELVTELALEGGPRIQRVNELFKLLTQQEEGRDSWDPDLVQGHLGTMRDRFGLTVQWVETVDDERILTNFRILVEQVLALQKSWFYDRDLLKTVGDRSSLGTILIWLSRGLEAVCESVDDLNFALDSVFVDAAQRQVIEISFGGQRPPLLLSDLLDWVVKACRTEGPRMIQDSGKDGVRAFAPILAELRSLIQETRDRIDRQANLPDGMRTPRVRRAFQVVKAQLDEASRLASLVKAGLAPQIDKAWVIDLNTGNQVSLANVPVTEQTIEIELRGSNFRRHLAVELVPAKKEGLAALRGWRVWVNPPHAASAVFPNPLNVPDSAGAGWSVVAINDDGTQSNQYLI